MEEDIFTLGDIVLKGAINPADVTFSGALTPAQSKTFTHAIVDRSEFLKKVTIDRMGKLTKERSSFDIQKGQLTRFVSGQVVSDAHLKKLGKVGCKLDAQNGVTLNAMILKDTLDDNQDNPNFEQEQFDGFSVAFSNDLAYLGIAGVADESDVNATFSNLAKGWVQIAKESEDATKITNSSDSQIKRLKHLVKNLHTDIRGRASIVMCGADWDEYVDEVAVLTQSAAVLLQANAKSFKGYPIEVNNDMPQGTYLATIMANFVFGISKSISKERWYDQERSALRFKFVVNPDYEFDIKKWVTLSEFQALTLSTNALEVVTNTNVVATVTSAGAGLGAIEVTTSDATKATATFNEATGEITIAAVAAGEAIISVNDGFSVRTIAVTVT